MMKTILTSMITGAVTMGAAGMAQAQGYGYGGYGNHPMMSGGWFMGPIMMILMVVIIVVAVVVVMKMFGFGAHAGSPGTHDRSLAILNERFAKGEIDKAEYEERKKALGG